MRMIVAFDRWDPFTRQATRGQVEVEAESGDEAVSRAKVVAMAEAPGGLKIVAVFPAEDQSPPDAVFEGAEGPPDEAEPEAPRRARGAR